MDERTSNKQQPRASILYCVTITYVGLSGALPSYSSKAKGIYREAPRKGVKRRIFPSVKSQLGLSLTACEADDSL